MNSRTAIALLGALALGGCSGGDRRANEAEASAHPPVADMAPAAPPIVAAPPAPPPATGADSTAELARISAERDSLLSIFHKLTSLRAREVSEMRQDRNLEQIAIARRLGVKPSGAAEIERLRRAGRLVPVEDSTAYWVLRDLRHSVPLVTPDAHALLVELGRRFQARLDSLGLPRYRMKVTSALRSDESQAALRRTNANASRIVSAHEFGTTVDVSHERFALPAPARTAAPAVALRDEEDEMLEELESDNRKLLEAELGRTIMALRKEGALKVMMEDAQPVYHMTVARRFP
jgi:transcriptional regulator with XRE-family HTH domain